MVKFNLKLVHIVIVDDINLKYLLSHRTEIKKLLKERSELNALQISRWSVSNEMGHVYRTCYKEAHVCLILCRLRSPNSATVRESYPLRHGWIHRLPRWYDRTFKFLHEHWQSKNRSWRNWPQWIGLYISARPLLTFKNAFRTPKRAGNSPKDNGSIRIMSYVAPFSRLSRWYFCLLKNTSESHRKHSIFAYSFERRWPSLQPQELWALYKFD